MTEHRQAPPLTDEMLVAYLDQQLSATRRAQVEQQLADDPALAERLAWLARSSLPFGAAYAGLLARAPVVRLRERLSASPAGPAILARREHDAASSEPITTPHEPAKARGAASQPNLSRRQLIAAAVACLAVGAVAGRFSLLLSTRDESEGNWRDRVAQYMSLYTRESFADMPVTPQQLRRQLQHVGTRLGLVLDPDRVHLPGAELRFARLLSYDRQPIAQIAYLDGVGHPLALCITPAQAGVAVGEATKTETRRGLNVVYWSARGLDFMLIGHGSSPELRGLAEGILKV